MIIKVPIYVELDEKFTPDQLADYALLLRKEFYQVLNKGYKSGDYEKYISFERKKVNFRILTLGQVEEMISSQR